VTSGLARHVREQVLSNEGMDVRDNVHGIDVFCDEPNVRFFDMRANLTALKSPDPFFANLDVLLHTPDMVPKSTRDVVLLLNYALMRPEPVAQTVFSISAVEMLGQQQLWTEPQKQLIRELATNARMATSRCISDVERNEVAEAIERGLYKLSLRQGVLRLLKSLGLESLKKRWDDLYEERSKLVHGLAPRPGADYYDLASRAVNLCGRILLTFVAREIPLANAHVNEFYPPQ
jgi:hypothetical protein